MNEKEMALLVEGNIRRGLPIDCPKEEYPSLRAALQTQAAKWIDQQQHLYAQIALMEVTRLDALHQFSLFPKE